MASGMKVKTLGASVSTSSIGIDMTALYEVGKRLNKVDKDVYKAIQVRLRELALLLEETAKAEAPDSVKPTIIGNVRGMHIKVIAGPEEYTNKGHLGGQASAVEHKGRPGKFKHPVFGSKTTPKVYQEAHPFLAKALERQHATIIKVVEEAVMQGFRRLGEK